MAKAKYDGRKNLIPVHDHETAVMLGKRSAEARRYKKNQKAMLLEDIKNTVTERIKVPEPLYLQLKGLGIKITRLERVDKLIFYRALLKALKDGEPDRLLKIAEFAGMKFRDDDEGSASTMTPDTELMLSTLFAQGRKVEPKQPEPVAPAEAVNGADGAAKTEGAGETHAEPSITVFSGLG